MNLYKQYLYAAAITVSMLSIWSSSCSAFGDDKQARDSLSNIKNIGIAVHLDCSGMEEEELNSLKEKIERDVNQKLRLKGIKVHSGGSIDMLPYLFLEIESVKCGDDTHAMYITAKVMQEIVLKNDQSINSISPTWSSGGVIGITVKESIQDIVSKLVDEFIAAYLSVNPKDDVIKNI